MKGLYNNLVAINTNNTLLVFDGKHDWPPLRVMDKAFALLQLNAMQKGLLKKDENFISAFYKNETENLNKLLKEKKILEAAEKCREIKTFFSGIYDLDKCKKLALKINRNKLLAKQRYAEQLLTDKEQKYQQKLLRAMEIKDSIWWKNELSIIKHNAENLRNENERIMNRRLLSYLSLISYLYAKKAEKNYDYGELAKFLRIYEISDPDNPEVYFLKAEYYATRGYPGKVIPTLKKAVAKGFNEPGRLENNKSFHQFFDKKEFIQIIDRLKLKK